MKVLFNLTIRKQIWSLPEDEHQACRKCNGCISLSALVPKKLYAISYETGSYYCQYFQADVDGVTSENHHIPCSQFKPLRLKRL